MIVVEGLIRLIKKAVEQEDFQGFKINNEISFVILQFAYDTMLVCEGTLYDLSWIKALLMGFEMV